MSDVQNHTLSSIPQVQSPHYLCALLQMPLTLPDSHVSMSPTQRSPSPLELQGSTLSVTRGNRMLSSWPPGWLKTKWYSLDLGMMKWSWISSPSMEQEKAKTCRVDSESWGARGEHRA